MGRKSVLSFLVGPNKYPFERDKKGIVNIERICKEWKDSFEIEVESPFGFGELWYYFSITGGKYRLSLSKEQVEEISSKLNYKVYFIQNPLKQEGVGRYLSENRIKKEIEESKQKKKDTEKALLEVIVEIYSLEQSIDLSSEEVVIPKILCE
jgi:hypothetical protein